MDGVSIYDPASTRPLNVTNTDNRLIASATRLAIEPILAEYITRDQNGFLRGRSMLGNLVDIDEGMARAALQEQAAIALFFDFAVAFPSVEHAVLDAYFTSLGWPPWLRNIIKALYSRNFCYIQMGSSRYDGFPITRGVRQGCPLSPLLFAAISELLLRRLRRSVPRTINRAYADDLAMIVYDGINALPILFTLFSEFASFSGLVLNIDKTVLVPLFPFDILELRRIISLITAGWRGISIADCAKYLGFFVGPGKKRLSWTKPVGKFLERSAAWGSLGLGLHMSLRAFRCYIASVLLFVAQLEHLPEGFSDIEAKAVRRLVPGPYRWTNPEALKELMQFGFPTSLACVPSMAHAAKSRVLQYEARDSGGLDILNRASQLRRIMDQYTTFARLVWVHTWISGCFLFSVEQGHTTVQHALREVDRLGRAIPALVQWRTHLAAAADNIVESDEPRRKRRKLKLSWQSVATKILQPRTRVASAVLFDRRLANFPLRTLHGRQVPRVFRIFERISALVAPRVFSAYYRSICDGWSTLARHQHRGSCRFGCHRENPDSLAHIAKCPIAAEFALRYCHLARPPLGVEIDFLLCLHDEALNPMHSTRPRSTEDDVLVRRVLHLYALYRLHVGIRTHSFLCSDYEGGYRQYLAEGRLASDLVEF